MINVTGETLAGGVRPFGDNSVQNEGHDRDKHRSNGIELFLAVIENRLSIFFKVCLFLF